MTKKKPARKKPAPIPAGPPPGTLAGLWEWFPLSPIKTRAGYERAATVAGRMAVHRLNAVQRNYKDELLSLIEAFEKERGETDPTLARLKAIAKTIPDPQAIKDAAKRSHLSTTAPPIRYPEHPGTPLRSQQFPTIEQAAQLAATLANGKLPTTDKEAAELATSALRLWRVSRDQINKEQTLAGEYWQKMDTTETGKMEGHKRIQARLKALGAPGKRECTWKEAAALLWPKAKPNERDSNLASLVSSTMAGKEPWREWTVEHFREFGFMEPWGFSSLIYAFDAHEQEREREALRQEMSERGIASAEKRKAKREEAKREAAKVKVRTRHPEY